MADDTITTIKDETFSQVRDARQLWFIVERDGQFEVRHWMGQSYINGEGVGPPTTYPTLRKAASRLLQLLGTGAVAPQTWPEEICIGSVTTDCTG
jgi:hypothetical protein